MKHVRAAVGRLLPIAGVVALGAVVAACTSAPLSRDEVDYPENLKIPPDLVGERQAEAERRQREREERLQEPDEDAEDGIPSDPVATIPTRISMADGEPVLDTDLLPARAWQLTGRALDRLDFTVLDRDEDDGVYRIRYAPFAGRDPQQPGFFARVFLRAERIDTSPRPFRIRIEEHPAGSRVTVREDDGERPPEVIAERLLTLFDRQLHE